MSEPTEREWLEGIGERFEREHHDRVSVPDRDLLQEALTRFEMPGCLGVDRRTDLDSLVAAARAWLEQGNAIIIQRDDAAQLAVRIGKALERIGRMDQACFNREDFPADLAMAFHADQEILGHVFKAVFDVLSVEGDQ